MLPLHILLCCSMQEVTCWNSLCLPQGLGRYQDHWSQAVLDFVALD